MNFSRPSLGLGFIGLNLSAYILDNNLVGNTYICKNEYDMRVQSILLSLTMVLAFISCGTQKATVSSTDEGPIIQTKFLGVEFGDSPFRVYNRISHYRPVKSNDGSYTVTDQDFGGYSWHFVQMQFVEKMLYIVNFQQEYLYESAANDRFDSIYQMLRMKYGDMKPTSNGNGFSFTDAHKNMVTITVHPGTSKGGQDFWYCDLTYYWGDGALLTYMKSLNEI